MNLAFLPLYSLRYLPLFQSGNVVNGASPAGLNPLQQSAADANANITAIAGAVQDLLTAEARGDLFANVQNVVTGKISAEDAVAQAIALN